MNPLHRAAIKRFSLGDKEAESRLVGLYNVTLPEDRPMLMRHMLALWKTTAKQLKDIELTKLEEDDAQYAEISDRIQEASWQTAGSEEQADDEAEVTELRRTDPGGPDGAA